MTKPAHGANPHWLGFFRAALVAALVTLFGAGTASAATASAAQTRVGPHTLVAPFVVGPGCGIGAGQRLGNDVPAYDSAFATSVAAKSVPDFIGSADGVLVSTSRGRMVQGFEDAGLSSRATSSPGRQYTLPDSSLVRVMEPSGQARLRASFTNSNGGPISPFTGKPVQPPSGLSKLERLDFVRSRTHVELGP